MKTFIIDEISLDEIFKGRASNKLRMTPLNDYNKKSNIDKTLTTKKKTKTRRTSTNIYVRQQKDRTYKRIG